MEAKPLIPKLRFPEFNDMDGWPVRRLDESVVEFLVPMRDKPTDLTGDIPWCRIDDFDGMYLAGSKSGWGVSSATVKEMNLRVFAVGTLLVSCSADLGRCAIVQRSLVTNQTFIGLVPRVAKSSSEFLFFLMTSLRGRLNALSSGTTISYLSRQSFESLPVAIPSPPEQKKIAECLTSLDELIAAEGRKLEALRTHKKGLMQNLFPREGETVPRLRFPEFRDAGEWEEKKLSDVCSMRAGEFVAASEIAAVKGQAGFPCFGGNGLRGYVQSYTHDGTYVLVGRQGALCGNVNMAQVKFHATEHAVVATPNGLVNVGWLYYALGYLNLNRFATGQAQPGLSVAVLNEVDLCTPAETGEQSRIADCLTSLDALITAQVKKLDTLKLHKQGLMQGLFPSPEVRLT